jgi:integrase/recombinase XerC
MLRGRRKANTSRHTLAVYWQGANRLLDWCRRRGVTVHQLTEDQAHGFAAALGDLAPQSQIIYVHGARAVLKALRWAGMGKGDPFEHVRVSDPTPAGEKANPYSLQELGRLLEKADSRQRALVLLGADAGLRISEAAALTWGDLDFERRRLRIRGKGGKVQRVAATQRLLEALRELAGDGQLRGPVFGIATRRVDQLLRRLCKRASVKPRGFHALRHAAGTRLYQQTKDLALVQRHLRHSSPNTSRIYVKLAEGDYEQAVQALEENGL